MTSMYVATRPIEGQRPGTSGLRKKTRIFAQTPFLENFIQSTIDAIGGVDGGTFVVGGDGRYFNTQAASTILRMLAANGAKRVIMGQGALLSTPAVSDLIRKHSADGGFILSASHNPGGPEEDFGVKYNIANGGPAPERVTEAIFARTKSIDRYLIAETADVALDQRGTHHVGEMMVEIVDPTKSYTELMERLFDCDAIRALLKSDFSLRFDAMHAVTGPYAQAILVERLGASPDCVVNATPLMDFGGGHPDPNPVWAETLFRRMMSESAPDFGAASDGDGDRNLILGRNIYVTPSDSLAILVANAHLIPAFQGGLKGVARSMPTSRAVDRVAAAIGIECHETPTGWKYFGNLLDAGRLTICGEESAGAGADHVREKDGLWAVLFWLNILAVRRQSVAQIVTEHWRRFGRNYYARHDYEAIDAGVAGELMADLRARLGGLPGQRYAGLSIETADDFSYLDPVDGSRTDGQGIRIGFSGDSRLVLRLSGTGTEGATLRLYLERYEADERRHSLAVDAVLETLARAADEIAGISLRTGRTAPDVIS